MLASHSEFDKHCFKSELKKKLIKTKQKSTYDKYLQLD